MYFPVIGYYINVLCWKIHAHFRRIFKKSKTILVSASNSPSQVFQDHCSSHVHGQTEHTRNIRLTELTDCVRMAASCVKPRGGGDIKTLPPTPSWASAFWAAARVIHSSPSDHHQWDLSKQRNSATLVSWIWLPSEPHWSFLYAKFPSVFLVGNHSSGTSTCSIPQGKGNKVSISICLLMLLFREKSQTFS